MTKWQSIETAPKDGTFLVYLCAEHRVHSSRIGIARFHPKMKIINGMFAHDLPEATHWMPLPDPPTD